MSIEIITQRLVIRTPTIEDADAIQAAKEVVWPQLQLWMSWANKGEETLEATERFINRSEEMNFLIGICRETGQFVLSTGINPRANHDGQFETGYWVSNEFLNKGYATEATKAVINYAFKDLKADSVYICHYEGNGPSRRVIEKLGFTKTGIIEKGHARCLDGVLLDVHEFIMTKPPALS